MTKQNSVYRVQHTDGKRCFYVYLLIRIDKQLFA